MSELTQVLALASDSSNRCRKNISGRLPRVLQGARSVALSAFSQQPVALRHLIGPVLPYDSHVPLPSRACGRVRAAVATGPFPQELQGASFGDKLRKSHFLSCSSPSTA